MCLTESGSWLYSTCVHKAGTIAGTAPEPVARARRILSWKANHSRPHISLVKYLGENRGTNTRQVARFSLSFSGQPSPERISRSMKPAGAPPGRSVSAMMSLHRSANRTCTQWSGFGPPEPQDGVWA
ncbi:hypothetical protein SAV14893_052910 [Streptomyces avermitilis]|uniref:Uncharacterized protein n=1 Tax=Streptomyces avermitilis TaxID=33903 RepID=A0A4D4M253_STRAX|nr:hypothetical protein SAV14893_052910 [Streptomyces avermitilis]